MAISVNILAEQLTTDRQPRWKNGRPHHNTTGVASASSIHLVAAGPIQFAGERRAAIESIAIANSGVLNITLTQSRRFMSASSGLASSSAATLLGSSAIPQIGQFPGSSRTISGC